MTTKLNTLLDLLLESVKGLYSAENQLLKSLPKMEKKASNQKLKEAFRLHLLETEDQIARLDEIGGILNQKLLGKNCWAMQGIIEEAGEVIDEESESKGLIDALLIGAAQKAEHFEIASYSCTHAIALTLGQTKIAKLLQDTLEEEKKASLVLFSILNGEILAKVSTDTSMNDDKRGIKPAFINKSQSHRRAGNSSRVLGIAACFAISHGSIAFAESRQNEAEHETEAKNYKNDNTGRNVRDRNDSRITADDQKMGGSEIEVLARIRRELVDNENLSTNGRNVKIVIENGNVILRGPVKSSEEKAWIQDATVRLAGKYSVVNQLEITPS